MEKKPFHNQKIRWLTAILGLSAAGLFYYWLQDKAILLLTMAIALISYKEYLQLLLDPKNRPILRNIKIYFSIGAAGLFVLLPTYAYTSVILMLILGFTILVFSEADRQEASMLESHLRDIFCIGFGIFYIVNFLFYLPKIHAMEHGAFWLISLLFTIFIGDALAYYGGSYLGKHKISSISPSKTWEGMLFHVAGSVTTLYVFHISYFEESPTGLLLGLGALISVLAQIGDFFESILKRVANVKDSGTLLPGHGGALDRFDALILTSPCYYYALLYLEPSLTIALESIFDKLPLC